MKLTSTYLYLFICVLATATTHIIIKWQVSLMPALPDKMSEKLMAFFQMAFNPWIWMAVLATLIAGLTWFFAISTTELTRAYPMLSLSFILIILSGHLLFNEPVSLAQMLGSGLITVGLFVICL